MKAKTLTQRIYKYIKRSVRGRTSAQIHRFTSGTGDATRLVRYLQSSGIVRGYWRTGKHYKLNMAVK